MYNDMYLPLLCSSMSNCQAESCPHPSSSSLAPMSISLPTQSWLEEVCRGEAGPSPRDSQEAGLEYPWKHQGQRQEGTCPGLAWPWVKSSLFSGVSGRREEGKASSITLHAQDRATRLLHGLPCLLKGVAGQAQMQGWCSGKLGCGLPSHWTACQDTSGRPLFQVSQGQWRGPGGLALDSGLECLLG